MTTTSHLAHLPSGDVDTWTDEELEAAYGACLQGDVPLGTAFGVLAERDRRAA